MSDKGDQQVESIENAGVSAPSSLSKRTRLRAHCGRRWLIYLVLFLLVALGIIFGVIFGAVPKIAQDTVNSSTITVDGIAILDPTNQNFVLDMNSTVHANPPVSSHFQPQVLDVYLPPTGSNQTIVPFMQLSLGRLNIENVFAINVSNAETNILDQDQYNAFSNMVLNAESLELGIKSNPEIYVGSLHFHVNYQKTVTLNGLNGLKGITLTNARVLSTPEADGTNMLTDCNIPNPSTFTLQVGDLTVDMSVSNIPLGYATIKNLTLYPGNNNVTVNGYLSPGLSTNALILASLASPNVPIELTANSTIFNGQHVEWLEGPLKAAPPVNATLNPTS